ncbi:hypothetical protein BHY_1029 (plasmid) [Borrelia nietonii YOR]|uniref:Uncharacterized protein n=2 Tax=Borrelia TaxID=138 RepID=W5SAM1_9SPIR|nr:hypothetical protein BHY_1029 [Borrelia nietonii YOR]AHH14548.1 hypothetical protein BHW_0024600 [Borrelia hermsii MTW]
MNCWAFKLERGEVYENSRFSILFIMCIRYEFL